MQTYSKFIVSMAVVAVLMLSTVSAALIAQEPSASASASKSASATKPQATEQKSQTAEKKTPQEQRARAIASGVEFLLKKGRADDGSFSKQLSPAVTALCISAMVRNKYPVANENIQQSLKYLETLIQPDGGIYATGSNLKNYETSVSLIAFVQCNVDGKYDLQIENAANFLKGLQWDEGEGYTPESKFFGGQGYGKHKRPDLSNTSFFLDALKELAGENGEIDSDAVRKATIFVSRTQNLPSEHNTAEFAQNVSPDSQGGMIYSPVGKGETKAKALPETPEGGLRSYASMTYAGLKSFLYAGLDKDDIRVKAALDWIRRHYDLDTNPGMGKQGLYYYYHVFARTMHTLGDPTFSDSDGKVHDWRAEVIEKLASQQKDDGSWTNEADRWYEGDPNLVTAYSLLTLSYCGDLPKKPAK